MITLAKNLKAILKTQGLTSSSLSRACGIPNTTLSNWLSGQPPKNVLQLKTVAEFFDLTIEELTFGEKPKQLSEPKSILKEFVEDEIYAGKYEVVLRRIKK
jgi:transcriptional regulator with XRE-family HTH domain